MNLKLEAVDPLEVRNRIVSLSKGKPFYTSFREEICWKQQLLHEQ
jgi:hypothetical protein